MVKFRIRRWIKRSKKPLWLFDIRDRIAYQSLQTSRLAVLLTFIAVCINAAVATVAFRSLNLNSEVAERARAAAASQTALNHQMADAATKQAQASADTATAAKQSANVSEKALRITQRAYFSISPKLSMLEKNAAPKAELTVRNIGTTPGYRVTLKSFIALVPYPLADSTILPEQISGTAVATMVTKDEALGSSIALVRAITEEEFKSTEDSRSRIVVYATLAFDDAFGCKIERKFCVLFNSSAAQNGNPEVCSGGRNDERYLASCGTP